MASQSSKSSPTKSSSGSRVSGSSAAAEIPKKAPGAPVNQDVRYAVEMGYAGYLNVAEAANYLRLSKSTIYRFTSRPSASSIIYLVLILTLIFRKAFWKFRCFSKMLLKNGVDLTSGFLVSQRLPAVGLRIRVAYIRPTPRKPQFFLGIPNCLSIAGKKFRRVPLF